MIPVEEVIIRIKGDPKDIDALVKQLGSVKTADAENAKQFHKSNEDFKKQQKEKGAAVTGVAGDINKALGNIKGQLLQVGQGIVAAFAVSAIIDFGKESVKAFQEAELNAMKLKAAILGNGGTVEGFNKLIKQSEDLQKITVFSDDDIQRAQTMATQFGYNADQIKKLMPIVADFASGTGMDLDSALQAVIKGTEGSGKALKLYGVDVQHTGDLTADTAFITQQLTDKFGGMSDVLANSTIGRIRQFENQIDDLQELLGGKLTDVLSSVIEEFNDLGVAMGITSSDTDAMNSAISAGEKEYLKYVEAQKKAKGSTFDLATAEKEYLKQYKDRMGSSDIEITVYSKIAKAVKERTKELKEENTEVQITIKNAAFYKQAIEAQTQIIDANTSSIKQVQAAVKEKNRLEELSAILLGKETEAMKEAEDQRKKLLDERKRALEELIKKETELRNTANVDLAQSEYDKVNIQAEAQAAELEILFQKTDKGIVATDSYNNAIVELYRIADGKIIEIQKKKYDEELKNQDEGIAAYEDFKKQIAAIDDNDRAENLKKEADAAQKKRDIQDAGFNIASQAISTLQSLNDSALEYELRALDKQLANKEISQKEFDDKSRIAKQKAAEENKKLAIFNIILSTAQAVISALAMLPPNVPLSIAAGVIGGLQLVAVASQPVPQFAQGTEFLKRGSNRAGVDTIPIMANEGEAIIPSHQNAKHPGLAAAWIRGNIDDFITAKYINPKLSTRQRELSDTSIQKLAKAIVMNQQGFYDGNIVDQLTMSRAVNKEQVIILKTLAANNSSSSQKILRKRGFNV